RSGGGGGGAPAEEKPALTDTHILYIQGYPVADGETLPQVRPQGEITRAEVATIFWRLLKDEAKTVTANGSFPDVPRFEGDDWYVQQVNYLTKIGVLTGYPDGTFQPNAKITRAELATILSRFAAYTGEDVSNPFSDVADHWAYKNIMTAVKNGWINGYPDGTFRPQQNITRAETMVMINRALGRNPSDNSVLKLVDPAKVYNDISGHWAWLDVLEASIEHEYSRAASDSTEDWIEIHWYEIGKLPADYWLKGVKEWTLTVRR
ncbi:MAG: S-layer homology domain-containing protein, partial [Oscillospiraceae bacterium]|nr:S-layer homology domain-containing protein [Oscillospiraceae bacterium]